MDRARFIQELHEHADTLGASLHLFADCLADSYEEVAECVEAAYAEHGRPYGNTDEGAWRWYVEHAVAHHLATLANNIAASHDNMAAVHALLFDPERT